MSLKNNNRHLFLLQCCALMCIHLFFVPLIQCATISSEIATIVECVVDIVVLDETIGDFSKESSNGVGFIIDENGYVITNAHVIDASDKIKIITNDGREYKVRIVGKDDHSDIALLKIDSDEKFKFLQFVDSDTLEIGEPVFAVGNPLGLGPSVTSGILSSKGRNLSSHMATIGAEGKFVSFLQTDAAVNHGNSGGPLCNYNGKVVGMITVFFSDGVRSTGLNFAIPSNMLQKVTTQLRNYGKMQRSWLGISIERIQRDVAISLGLGKRCGCNIVRVYDGSPAARGGIQTGDILLALNDESITEDTNTEYLLSSLPIGSVIPVLIMRNGNEMKFSVTVGSKNDEETGVVSENEGIIKKGISAEKIDELGISVADLTPELRKIFNIPENIVGVVIIDVGEYSSKLSYGNIIVNVKFSPTATVAALKATLQQIVANKERNVALYLFNAQAKTSSYQSIYIKHKNNSPISSDLPLSLPKEIGKAEGGSSKAVVINKKASDPNINYISPRD
ncbi:MAG: trypsin-like peptidase domain-containing protein [Holosporaceae bacterium]|nr:trypsin-like peptidase domain-containing protein [Holosporaceae bacterium]